MARFGGSEQCAPVTWIEHHMMDDVAEEMRTVGQPLLPRGIAAVDPGTLARGDKQLRLTCHWRILSRRDTLLRNPA
jgi:hypothetical protein